ncbi:uncharacterized protein LOC122380906 isoform X1 [Amphibalanus amphitrite]|uniref:uncharacterized protein LOC122380906 isoform X1 n=1 Tax=Amphibalanus amphitrite TaxID=1232801 RepID=UPI001C9137FA|nr:uncharacterized protein LOC122380906 isoform X1 [Amphibalanus amphitrite]
MKGRCSSPASARATLMDDDSGRSPTIGEGLRLHLQRRSTTAYKRPTAPSAQPRRPVGFIWMASATPHAGRCSCPRCRPRIFRNAKLEDMKLLPNLKDVVRWRPSARVPLPTRPQERPHYWPLCIRGCSWQAPWKLKGRGPVAAVGQSPSPDTV